MESLYVLETGAYLRKEGDALKVIKGNRTVDRIPAEGLKRLMLMGYVSLSGPVLDFLINRRVETVFITPTGRYRARLMLDPHRHVTLRKAQYRLLDEDPYRLKTAAAVVHGKLTNLGRLLKDRAGRRKDRELATAAAKVAAMAKRTQSVDDMETLRGLEGAGTAAYFTAFPNLIQNDAFSFNGRNRRPPKDPVNAMLSFVYTLLTNEVLSAVNVCGLDPYLGALHEIAYGRPSLACDLVEEYRAFLGDRLVLGLINRRLVRPDDFILRGAGAAAYADEQEMRERRPVEMKPATARAFIASYEEMMNRMIVYPPAEKRLTYRQLMLHQVRRFGEALEKGEEIYRPFLWPGR
jgi:CRISPR-associated protein Cas1